MRRSVFFNQILKETVDEAKAAYFKKWARSPSDEDLGRASAHGGGQAMPPNVPNMHGPPDAHHPDTIGPLRNVPGPKPRKQLCIRFTAL